MIKILAILICQLFLKALASQGGLVDLHVLPEGAVGGTGPLGGDLPPPIASKDKPWSLVAVDVPIGGGAKLVELRVLRFPALPNNKTYIKYYNGVAIVLLVNERLAWKDAVKKCQSYGLQPTSYDSLDEFNFHMQMLNDNRANFGKIPKPWSAWTAGNDLYRGGHWTYISSGRNVPGFYGGRLSTDQGSSSSGSSGCNCSGNQVTGGNSIYNPEEGKHCLQIQQNNQDVFGGAFDAGCLLKSIVMCKEANY